MSHLSARLAALPSGPLYRFQDAAGVETALDVDALRVAARALAEALRDERGAPVLVVAGPGAEHPVGLFATWEAGAFAVPLYPPVDAAGVATIAAVAKDCGARVLLASRSVAEALLPALGARGIAPRWVELTVSAEGPRAGREGPGAPGDTPAILLYTSGSTGAPKGAILRHESLLHNMDALAAACGRSARDVVCTWLPHAHVAGLYTRLLPVALGARGTFLPPAAFLQRPLAWVEALSAARATITAAPDFAYALAASLIQPEQAAALDLSAMDLLVSGGEVVRPATVDRFLAAFAPSGLRAASVHPYYGLTETLCTSIPQGRPPLRRRVDRAALARGRFVPLAEGRSGDDAQELLSNGPPLPGTEVVVVDPERGAALPPGRVGELWTRGPGVIRAYTGDPARSFGACAATLDDGSGPWFRTGDLGVLDGGEVFVTGRHKELLIVRGKNHTPPDLEATVTAATAGLGVREVAAFPVSERGEEALGLALELDGTEPIEVARRTRRAVSERHGLAVAAMYLVPPGTLPRTPTRKLARHACARLAAEGRWAAWAVEQASRPVPPPSDASLTALHGAPLRAALRARLVAMTGAPSAETAIADLGLSSLDVARAAAALRLATGVEPPFAPFFDGSTLAGLAGALADTMEGVAAPGGAVPGWRALVAAVVERLPTTRPPLRRGVGPVFLTGATGFLGAWILAELLRAGHEVRCLVRAPDAAAGEARLRKALAAGPGIPEEGRLVPIPGDLTLPRLGLAEPDWLALGEEVAVLVHNAADVNFVAPYPALRAANVDPVLPLLDLALAGGVARPLHFVSTLAVFNTRSRREQRRILGSDRVTEPELLYSGYAQSKWVAEALLKVASAYAVPVAVHRPGLIVGASATGQAHRDDFLCRFLQGCVELGVYPDAAIELDLVAVDHVAAGIAAQVGRPIRSTLDPYHWTTASPTTLHALVAAYAALGHPLRPEPLGRWLDRIRTELPADNALFPVHPFLLERPGGAPLTLLELLDGLPLQIDPAGARPCPPVDPARMAGWLQSSGFLPVPKRASE